MAISPLVTFLLAAVATAIILTTRYVSLATLTCAALAPILLWSFGYALEYVFCIALISLYIIFLHRGNIQRLLSGEENKV